MTIEHVVEVRAARIAVVGGIAGEALGDEQAHNLPEDPAAWAARSSSCARRASTSRSGCAAMRSAASSSAISARSLHQLGEPVGDVFDGSALFGRLVTMSSSVADPSVEQVRETVADCLRAVGQRLTANRQSLLDALINAPRPLTIPEILDDRPGLAELGLPQPRRVRRG